jgi:hypothetical protein
MKKLLTLAITMVLITSCSNNDLSEMQEPIQIDQNFKTSNNEVNKKKSENYLIENAINLVKSKGQNQARGPLDPVLDPGENPNDPDPTNPEYEESGIICHTPYNQNSGSACVLNSSGNLVRVTWSLEMTDIGPGGSGGNGQTPIEPRRVYTGTVVSSCNC